MEALDSLVDTRVPGVSRKPGGGLSDIRAGDSGAARAADPPPTRAVPAPSRAKSVSAPHCDPRVSRADTSTVRDGSRADGEGGTGSGTCRHATSREVRGAGVVSEWRVGGAENGEVSEEATA